MKTTSFIPGLNPESFPEPEDIPAVRDAGDEAGLREDSHENSADMRFEQPQGIFGKTYCMLADTPLLLNLASSTNTARAIASSRPTLCETAMRAPTSMNKSKAETLVEPLVKSKETAYDIHQRRAH